MPLPIRRLTSASYPAERRQGYIDPRDHDDPPFSEGHPFSALTPCICCEPGCSCGQDQIVYIFGSVNRPNHRPQRPILRRTVSLSTQQGFRERAEQSPGSSSSSSRAEGSSSAVAQVGMMPWPFHRSNTETISATDSPTQAQHHPPTEADLLGPLGSLIAELRAQADDFAIVRAWTRTALTTGFWTRSRSRSHGLTHHDIRELWAAWILKRRRLCRDERAGEVQRGRRGSVRDGREVLERARSAEVHGWI